MLRSRSSAGSQRPFCAAVAAGTLPRVEVTYVQPDDKDSASGCIQAVALIPDVDESGGGVKSLETVPVPFDTAAVDIREVLADGIRAAARRRLAGVLEGVAAAAAELGLAPTLENAAVNPAAAGATAAGARGGWRVSWRGMGKGVEMRRGERRQEVR